MLSEQPDGALISLFINDKREDAFDTLFRRYYNKLYRRFSAKTNDDFLAHDLCQKLWMRVLRSLPKYQDNDKFEHYLNTIASNLLRDEWRGKSNKKEVSTQDETGEYLLDQEILSLNDNTSIGRNLESRQAVDELIHHLIPSLPCHQRLVFLLRHESEYWDDKQPLQWQHVAELNNVGLSKAYQLFESSRDKLIINTTHEDIRESLSCEEKAVFLLWTQAQRPDKSKKYTEAYFANLLNISVNTFKTRYRASIKVLSKGLEKWK